ncbi:tetratricopeptide repeat protein [Stieleria sp. ICT_E10.1]|uniref:tetratricopeptide repeat protein n=1 Tax=Stieleria sedimenti TaxID=2976331 RepID=UPI00217FD8B3|nr:tetratricopeptide repeat protein [Stieleria sedimenti]MCS7466641.1 tetratricopeptide repeat protein [Stieleria sedimenti]
MIHPGNPPARAQDPDPAKQTRLSEQERATAEKFLQVLLRRPRPGTALDRVYGFHVQNGTLDEFIASLDVPDDAQNAGQQRMILGLLQAQRGRQALAAEAFAEAESLLGDDYASSYFLGRSLLAVGQTEKAAAALERAIERKPARNEALPIFTELGRIYSRAGQNEKAIEVWQKLEALFPGDTRVGSQIASTLADEGNVQAALQRFERLAKSARKDDEKIAFAVQAAEMRRRLGQTEQCTEALEAILARLRPGSWLYSDVRNRIEQGFLKSGDYDALADYYQQKLAGSPDDLALQVRLGRILVSAQRIDEAAETLSKAVERAPDDADVRLALIDVLVNKADMAAAADQFEQLAEQDPDNPDYLLRWGQILLEDDTRPLAARRNAAAAVWQRLADRRDEDAVTLSQIADRMRGIDRKQDAIGLYEQAIEVEPDSPQYREYLGEYLYRLDRKDEAIETWNSIAEGDRRSRDSLVRLAEIFATFKEDERSLTAWREASELDLTFPQELRFAQKLRDAEQYDEAISRLDAAANIAETPDEQEQLLKDRIATYQQAGTLAQQIAQRQSADPTVQNLRTLAMMHAAAGQLADAEAAIRSAIEQQPDDPNVLLVAAEISERQNRFADAASTFQKLARVDVRFQTNYLQRVADLQMRLGQVDQAMQTCDALIDANPASPESYQFLARLALRAGRDDQAFTALRRAMNVAPRDNGPRRMLASAFADRYRTEEAVELYWQAMRYESEADARIALVNRLAPLYDRQNEMDALIARIDQMARDDVDERTVQLMVAAAHEAVRDYGAARQAIDRLLAGQPRDVSLLETMVRLSDAADEVTVAAEFQERIVAIADTPENRFKLVQLQLDAGMIDIKSALSDRIALAADPTRLGSMIRSAVRRGDRSTAIAVCEEAVRRDPGLWDVKLMLAQLLLYERGDDETLDGDKATYPAPHRRAIELADELRQLDLPLDALPPAARTRTTGTSTSTSRPPGYATSPSRWTGSSYTLARNYRVGRYASSNYSSMSSSYATIDPSSFGHARVLAAAVEMVAIAKRFPADEAKAKIDALIEQTVALPAVDQIEDANLIWEHRALQSIAGPLASTTTSRPASGDDKELAEKLNWRLAELDPKEGAVSLRSMLMGKIRSTAQNESSSDDNAAAADTDSTLTEKQLQLVLDLYEQAQVDAAASGNTGRSTSWSTLADYRVILSNHFNAVGDTPRAKQYALQAPPADASLNELVSAMSYYLNLNQVDQADALVERLMPAVRDDTTGKSVTWSTVTGTAGHLVTSGPHGPDFVERHRMAILDAVLAQAIEHNSVSARRSTALSNGTLSTYVRSSQNSYYSFQVKAPLSLQLLNQQIINELSSLMPSSESNGQPRGIKVSDEVIAHLDRPLTGAPVQEQKARRVLAAFACWWTKRPEECYSRLSRLCREFPDDVDLRIEQARLASELAQPRVALETLDSFDPLDSGMLVRKEMAALNLASQLGDVERAKQAAERLFGLRMDTKTHLALADQLRRLGMNDKATAVLRRLRGGRARDERTELQIASAFLANDDQEAAAEVAYTVLRKLNSGRGSSSNSAYYRRQAVSILKNAKRLEPLIEQAKRRVAAAPASVRARMELAELYTAAGKQRDAEALWGEIAKSKPNDPNQLLARAGALYKANQFTKSAELYLDAFEKEPQLLNRHVYEMTRAVERSSDFDPMYERLLKLDPEAIQSYRLDTLLNVGRRKPFTDAKRKFVAHALKNSQFKRDFYRYIDAIPVPDREKIPEIRQAMIDVICGDDAFQTGSTTWRVTSRSSGGTANGPLKDILALLRSDDEARERFDEAAKKALQDETLAPSSRFLSALVDVADDVKRDAAVESIRELIHSDAVVAAKGADTLAISGGLLWQGGQVLESISEIEDKTSLLVSIYQAAAVDPSVSRTDMRFSVGARLVNALAKDGQKARARNVLLDAYAKTDHSAEDQYNPGYGDYQEIQAYQSIAEKLNEIGFPIDAWIIFQQLIASPERFANAKRWGGGLSIEDAKKATEQVRKKITPASSAEYLDVRRESLDAPNDDLAIRLLDLPLEMMLIADAEPGLQIAIDSAAQTDPGRETLEAFYQSLESLSAKRTKDWSIPAAQLLVAMKIRPEDVDGLHDTLDERLPDVATIREAMDTPQTATLEPLTGLLLVASAASKSDSAGAERISKNVGNYLRVLASSLKKPGLDLAVASLGGDDASLAAMLDSIETLSQSGVSLLKPQLNACLKIARMVAKRGDIQNSARALKLALQNGPPISSIGNGTDAFAINTNQNVSSTPVDDGVHELTPRLLELIDLYSDLTGEKLGRRDPNAELALDADEMDQAMWQSLDQALRAVVLPSGQPGMVYPYAKRIASRTSYDNYSSNDDLRPHSVSIAMARVAAIAGTSDTLLDLIASRLESAADKKEAASVLVDAALASMDQGEGDSAELTEALERFAESVDAILPSAEAPAIEPERLSTISGQVQQESYQKSDIVDLMVRTLAPLIAATDGVTDEHRAQAEELFERTARLIDSDSYTTNRHREIARRIREKVLSGADKPDGHSDVQQTDSETVLGQQLDAIKRWFLGGGG